MQFPAIYGLGLLLAVAGNRSPILAQGPGRISPPFLAGICQWCWWVVPRQSWLRALGAVPRQSWPGSLLEAVGGSSPILAGGPGCSSSPFLAVVC